MTKRPNVSLDLIRRVLGTEYLELHIDKLVLEEDFQSEKSRVRLEVSSTGNGGRYSIAGEGVGLVNALVHALTQRFAPEYESLNTIELSSFSVGAKFDTKHERSGSDALGEVALEVTNSEGTAFQFSDTSRSIASSAARAVVAAIEYFVNAERAYITLYRARKDAQERDRADLVTRYTRELAEVVKSTSYADVIEKIRSEIQ
jgi:hypothetical protein